MQEHRPEEGTMSDSDSEEAEGQVWDEAEMIRSQSNALMEFRSRVEEAILSKSLIVRENSVHDGDVTSDEILKDIKLWGVPLLPSMGHHGTDVVLAKFLKARRYKVREAFSLLWQTLEWRAEFWRGKDSGPEMDDLCFTNGRDREGRPLFYTVLGKESGKRFMSTRDQKRYLDYFRWRIWCIETGIQSLDFKPGGVGSFIQIIDFKNAPGIVNKEIRLTYKKMLTLLEKNYPGLVHKTLVVNVPSWFLTLNTLNLRHIAQRGKNKFSFVKSSKVTETLLKYATIENILVQYGGLRRVNDTKFSTDDKVVEVDIRSNSTEEIIVPASEAEVKVTWDFTVVGSEVMYREEFIPDDECSYKVLLQEKKMGESVRNSFYIREPGKITVTIVNGTSTKKKAFYRYKSTPVVPVFTDSKS